jgi:hypothetical protein
MSRKKKIIEHQIVDISDIFVVVNKENFERFMMDFMLFVHQISEVKEKYPSLKVQGMTWKDDGVHEITGYSMNGNKIVFKKKTTLL